MQVDDKELQEGLVKMDLMANQVCQETVEYLEILVNLVNAEFKVDLELKVHRSFLVNVDLMEDLACKVDQETQVNVVHLVRVD